TAIPPRWDGRRFSPARQAPRGSGRQRQPAGTNKAGAYTAEGAQVIESDDPLKTNKAVDRLVRQWRLLPEVHDLRRRLFRIGVVVSPSIRSGEVPIR
ncbi:MAG: hypothetical protein ACI9W2_003365, partial [Gammaproteobacteria bacterium]